MLSNSELLNRIVIDSKIMIGKPIVRGFRITVEQVLKYLAAGNTFEMLKEDYPFLEPDDIAACLLYASKLVEEETVHSISA
jgi:uncharacterized protein (DUF433 family)